MTSREPKSSSLYPGERQDVEIFLSCRDLKPLDRFRGINTGIALYIERNGKYELDDQTERIKGNPNPDFKKSFNLEFFFAVRQNLKIVVSDFSSDGNEKVVGEVYSNVGQILGSKNQTVGFNITKDMKKDTAVLGRLIIRAERVNYTSDVAKLTMKARQLKLSKGLFSKPSSDFAIRLYRFLGDAGYGLVYESEIRKNESPRWSEFEILLQKLSNGDHDRKIKAQVVNYNSNGGNAVVGEGFFTVNSLLANQLLDYEIELINPKTQQKSGVLIVDNFDLIEKPHFLDYLHAGLQFNLMIGIDYTSSNRDPFTVDSLHTVVREEEMNEYQKAMAGVCEILLNYDYDKKVLMYGFGGIPNFPNFKAELTSHCFPLTGDMNNPWAEQLDGIMNIYKNSFKYVELASPTYFEPILKQAMQIAKKNKEKESNEYTILLMLTDGKCHDMQDSINAVIQSAFLPLSIIIVGVGDADFKKMEILDGDEGLANFKGDQAARDLVQFVPFRDFENNPDLLAKNVLAEIPNQVVTYMLSQGIKPNGLLSEDFKSIYKTVYTGIIDDESEEKKEENFYNTNSWIENSSRHFSKALEFMKKENNLSFVSVVRQNNDSPPNSANSANLANSALRVSKTTSFIKHDQQYRKEQSFY